LTLPTTRNERQPARLPFVLLWRLVVLAVAFAVLVSPTVVRAEADDIRVVAVDSIRFADLSANGASNSLHPVGDAIDDIARDINTRGGVLGRRLAVTHENDRCEGDEAAAVATRAVDIKAHVVIGHACSSGAIRAAAIYAMGGVVMIATGPRHPRLTSPAGRRGIYRLAGRDDRQAESIARLIATAFPAARTAIVHDQSLQGRGMADEIRRSAVAAKAAPLLVADYAAGTKDYAALVAQLVEAKIDLAVFSGQPLEASIILDQARGAGASIDTAVGIDTFAADAPPARLLAATRNFLVMLPWPGQVRDVSAGAGVGDDSSDRAPTLAGAALEVWAQAVGKAGSLGLDGVAEVLKMPASAVGVGTIRFDDKGDAVVPSFLPHVWREGRWQIRR
jgi:branched-chain amino acid transport system substrate-binding protein